MRFTRRKTGAFLIAALLLQLLSDCNRVKDERIWRYNSYSDIPGVTADEIEKIDALREQKGSFVYGMTLCTEAFSNHTGEIHGFSALFCDWLTDLFGIPFIPELYDWNELIVGMEKGGIDFTGELTATDERRETYNMTEAIAMRIVKAYRMADREPSEPLRYCIIEGTATIDKVSAALNNAVELILMENDEDAYRALKNGDADVFFSESTVEALLDEYTDVISEDFFPFIYSPISLSTQKEELAPVISIVQKALVNGGTLYLRDMYETGYLQYEKHKLYDRLDEEERVYLNSRRTVRIVADDDYPISFYNTHDGEWQGIAYDILRQIENLTGLSFETVNGVNDEWPSSLQMVERGEASIAASLYRSGELEGRFIWPETIYMSDNYAFLSKSDYHDIKKTEIMDLRIGGVEGWSATDLFMKWFPGHPNVKTYKDTNDIITGLDKGEIDAMVSRTTRLDMIINYYEFTGYKVNLLFDAAFETTFGLNKDETVLCSIIDKAMKLTDIQRTNSIWLHKTYDYRVRLEKERLPWLVGASVLLVCVLILMFFLFQRKRFENKKIKSLAHWYESILDAIPLPLSVTDMKMNCTFVNTATQNLLEKKRTELVGFQCSNFNTSICNTENCDIVRVKRGEKRTYFTQGEMSFRINAEILNDLNGKQAGFVSVVQDITDIEKMAKQQAETSRIQSEHLRTKLWLDAVPLACFLWNKDITLYDVNEAAVKMFEVEDKKNLIDNFFAFSPEYQPDGSHSSGLSASYLSKAFEDEQIVFMWMHQLIDGTPIPAEVTLVRVSMGNTYYVAGYVRDLRRQNKMMAEIEQRDKMLSAGHHSALLLLGATDKEKLDSSVLSSMEEIGRCIDVDRVQIWRTKMLDSSYSFNMKYKWLSDKTKGKHAPENIQIPDSDIHDWEDILRGKYVNGPLSELPENVRNFLSPYDIKAIVIVPLYVQDMFWGCIVLDDCTRERVFSEDESSITRSVGLMIVNSLLRYETDQKLYTAIQEAQSANKAKSSFLANMSHEIRTPMNAILGITEILMQESNLREGIEEGLGRIYNSSGLLLGIINDLLDFSRIEEGKLKINPVKYELASLINEVIQINKLRIGSKPVLFNLEVGENVPETLIGDELRIKQILNNLLSNAFKYTESGTVTFTVDSEPVEESLCVTLVFAVRDTGYGMTAEQISRLFDRFIRFNEDTKRATEGTGLGMSITQNLVRLMDGTIHVESEQGKGSEFTIRLPQKLNGSPSVLSRDVIENLNRERFISPVQLKKQHILRKYMPYGSVLIVDDAEANLYVAKLLMSPYGLKIETAGGGQEAIGKIKNGKIYDIIFMDHMMPEMDGIEAVKIIRSIGYSHPIIALTANAVVGQADIFLANGFNDFISKPIDMRLLDISLNKYIYEKQTPETLAAAQMEKEKTEEAAAEAAHSSAPAVAEDSRAGMPFDIPLLNTGRGLAFFEGEVEAYISTLRSYTENVPEMLDKLRSVTEENLNEYAINVHSLKSISGWICADDIRARAANLELLAKAGDLIGVTTLNTELIKETEDLISSLNTQLLH